MTFSERMQDILKKSLDASKEFLEKAGDKAQQLGEMGVLKFEIIALKNQTEKLAAQVGMKVYASIVERKEQSIAADDPGIAATLAKIADLDAQIDQKEARFKALGGKDEDISHTEGQ